MSLTGWAFPTLIALLAGAAFAALVVFWRRLDGSGTVWIAARAGSLLLVNGLVLLLAAVLLNAQFLFFADWTDLSGALSGGPTVASVSRGGAAAAAAGRAVPGGARAIGGTLPALPGSAKRAAWLTYLVRGAVSGLTGTVVVELPPGYTSRAASATRYPVLETFSGYPGEPQQWVQAMHLGSELTRQEAARRLAPPLVVSPQTELPAGVDTECVNGQPGVPQLETWLTRDVPTWVVHTFRVRTDRGSWATIGLSSGGWCAAMAALLHPGQYSAAIVMGGYFRPDFGPMYDPYPPTDKADANRYDLVGLASRAPPPVAIWLETSHSDAISYTSSAAFLRALRPPLAVNATVLQHAGHRISLWRDLLPQSLIWLGRNVPGFRTV